VLTRWVHVGLATDIRNSILPGKGYGFVLYTTAEAANLAVESKNTCVLQGTLSLSLDSVKHS